MDSSKPLPFIDPEKGVLNFQLCPVEEEYRWRLIHPLVPEGQYISVCGGMSHTELAVQGNFSSRGVGDFVAWFEIGERIQTEIGATPYPYASFESDRLVYLGLLFWDINEVEDFPSVQKFLEQDLGKPHESGLMRKNWWPFTQPSDLERRFATWTYPWGDVKIFYESRDWTIEVLVHWWDTNAKRSFWSKLFKPN